MHRAQVDKGCRAAAISRMSRGRRSATRAGWIATIALASSPGASAEETFFHTVQGWLTCTTYAPLAERDALDVEWLGAGGYEVQRSYFITARPGTRDYDFRYLTLLQAVAALADQVDDQAVRREVLSRIFVYTYRDDPQTGADPLFRQINRCALWQIVESLIGSGDQAALARILSRLVASYQSGPHTLPVEDWPLILALRDVRADSRVNSQLNGLVAMSIKRADAYSRLQDTDRAHRMWTAAARGLLELGNTSVAYQAAMETARSEKATEHPHARRWLAYPILFDYFNAVGKPEEAIRLEALFRGNFEPPDTRDSPGNFEVFHRLARGASSLVERYNSDPAYRRSVNSADLKRHAANWLRFMIAADAELKDYHPSLTFVRRALRERQQYDYDPDHLEHLTRDDPGYASRTAKELLDRVDGSIKRHMVSDVLVNKRARLILRQQYSNTIKELARLLPYVDRERDAIVEKTFQLAQLAGHNGASAIATSGLMRLNREGITANSLTWNLRMIENPASYLEMVVRMLDSGNRQIAPVAPEYRLTDAFNRLDLTRSDVFDNREQFAAVLHRRSPELAAFTLGAAFPLATFQRFLGNEEAVVATHLGAEAIYVWVVSKQRARLEVRQVQPGEVAELVRRIRNSVAGAVRDPLQERIPYDAEAAWLLYEKTFGALSDDLEGVSRVYWYGDKELGLIPPAILLTRRPDQSILSSAQELRSAHYLATKFPIVSLPEPTIYSLALNPTASSKREGLITDARLLGIGGTQMSEAELASGSFARSIELAGAVERVALADLPKLAETVATLRAIEQAVGVNRSTLWLGPAATKKRLVESDLSAYRTIVFATHGFLSGEVAHCGIGPHASLLLTMPDSRTARCTDALLTTRDISQLKLDADLVVLSACNTARGGSRGGLEEEPFFGLAAAFGAAGARNLMVSHWPVLVGAAGDLVSDLIRTSWEQGTPLDASLHAAMQTVRDKSQTALEAHPAYWGPFVLIGSGRTGLATP